MSTIGALLLPQFQPFDLGRTLTQATNIQGGQLANQTQLLALQEARRQQEAEALARQTVQQDPSLLYGGSVLGSLGPPPAPYAPPGGAPLTQQTVLPGQPPGAPQVVPGGQDLSRFAAAGGPPQSTLASLAPQGQTAPPHPHSRLLELARTNPDAARLVQQQMQQQEDLALRRQEQRLTMGTKVMEYVGRLAQGVTDQASLDAARTELQRVHPQAAAQLPQVYSREAMAPFLAKALDVKEALTLQVQDLQAQAAVIKARKEGRSTDVDNQLRGMGVQPGQETPEQMREALRLVQEGRVAVSASHGTGQLVQTPQGIVRVDPRTGSVEPVQAPGGGPMYPKPSAEEQKAETFGDLAHKANVNALALEEKGLKPSVWDKATQALPFGMGNYLVSEDRQKYEQAVRQFAQAWLRKTSGAAVTPQEFDMTNTTYFPQPGDSQAVIEQKRQSRADLIRNLQEEGKQTGRSGGQGQPPGQAPLKPVGEMSREELLAERERLRKGGS